MEWQKQPPPPPQQPEDPGGGVFVKVMTDEQMEVLRKQIAVYAAICEQLVELHKSLTSHNDLAGMRLGNMYCDTLIASGTHKITGRQRWTPTAMQLQILERMFDQGIGTPSKQKIKEITVELSQHGQISETNVYNWFQNRRARSKRKQQSTPSNKEESEVDTEVESPTEKKAKPPEFQAHHALTSSAGDLCFQDHSFHSVDTLNGKIDSIMSPEGSSKFGDILGQMPFYGSTLSGSSAGIDQIMGKMEVQGNYNYLLQDGYSMD